MIEKTNDYINVWSVVLNTILIFETIYILHYARKYKNGLSFILGYLLTFFYSFRVLTLTFSPFSSVMMRSQSTSTDLNYTLFFIIFSSFALFLGIHFGNKNTYMSREKISNNTADLYYKPKRMVFVLVFILHLLPFLLGNFSGILNYFTSIFLNAMYLLLSGFVFFIFFNKYPRKKTLWIFYALVLIFIINSMSNGSRSSLLTIANMLLFALLSIHGVVYLKLRQLLVLGAFVPAALFMFMVSTYIRQNQARSFSFEKQIELIKSIPIISDIDNYEFLYKIALAPVYNRIGFIDFSTELMAQKENYSSVINFKYYLMSIFDNVLSPGFDLFDTPKVANALIFIYDNKGPPSIKSLIAGNYQSDQLTIFGEFYNLLGGWFSIGIFIILGYILQKLILRNSRNKFYFYLKNAFILNGFYILINSFGLDWFVFNIVSLFCSYKAFIFILRVKNI